ncbi:MAG TPA: hypothetical protein VD835_13410 [Pyrinomonadaceae bacterium]|nr:hypothetical protein [Pyrinomonadaceae bacterium]
MKPRLLRSLTILTLAVVTFGVTTWAVVFVKGQPAQNINDARKKTLRERAQEQDVEFEMREGHHVREYEDLSLLAKHADAIVFGRILEEESYFSSDDYITTSYKVDVQRVIKDGTAEVAAVSHALGRQTHAPLATPLSFTRFGGAVQVNGHRASLKVKGGEHLIAGRTYILFLQWTGWNYHIAGGMSGAVLVEKSRLRPLGTNRALQLRGYGALDLEAFVRDVLGDSSRRPS